ncbi:sugar nucleotidyltransferase [Phaeocystidibacter luteus]|uniref:NTP transferase domain-containing protein n=1 Tax=Phaeocystidibacter luteus TaxID=911197 RepID=A0A6N6RKT4_9FLAO|nr:sugar phosphate nucleotidyltransferase [Phaeocystidibacter luteus]KAB2813869.1 NTP transferase domain-containing protein [Phaeocystidibacter luteus]
MKIIVPMAGRGSRLRPHTLTVPKPLIPIAGKPIVQRLVEDIVKVAGQKVEEIAFVIGDFGKETEDHLISVAESLGAKGSIYHQDEPLGTAHAILCAKPSITGPCVVAFADTLFRADFTLDTSNDGVIWVKRVEDPSAFGVVNMDDEGTITEFVEKPTEFVSDLAIIGIYFFKDGDNLRDELQYLIDNNITDKGEYQITDALDNMKNKGLKFKPGKVDEWMDCGNKDVTVDTNNRILTFLKDEENLVSDDVVLENSKIIEPCYIGKGVVLRNSTVGPHVSVGNGTVIENSNINTTIIQEDSVVSNMNLENSMIGNKAVLDGNFKSISLGDYCRLES